MWRSEESSYFHVCTDGTALPWLFQDDEDFIAGVNRIGICQIISGVDTRAFTLMDNHGHFVLYGTLLQCKMFINSYKTLTGKYISIKYGLKDHLRGLPAEIIPINGEEELMEVIAYLDRNPIMAGYKQIPNDYPWGSAKCIFREPRSVSYSKKIKELGLNEVRRLLRTRIILPPDWEIDSNGMLIPERSFFNVKKLENIFKSPLRYNYFLAKKLEGKIDLSISQGRKTFLSDKELRPIVRKIARSLFGTNDIKDLDIKSRLMIARELRYNYASTVKQIGRMLGLDPEVLKGFI